MLLCTNVCHWTQMKLYLSFSKNCICIRDILEYNSVRKWYLMFKIRIEIRMNNLAQSYSISEINGLIWHKKYSFSISLFRNESFAKRIFRWLPLPLSYDAVLFLFLLGRVSSSPIFRVFDPVLIFIAKRLCWYFESRFKGMIFFSNLSDDGLKEN